MIPFGEVAPPVGEVAEDDGGDVGEVVPLGEVSALLETPPPPPTSLLLTFPIAEEEDAGLAKDELNEELDDDDDDDDDEEEEVKTFVTLSITLPLMMVPILEAALGAEALEEKPEDGREEVDDDPPALEAWKIIKENGGKLL